MFPTTASPIDAQTINLVIQAGAVGVLFMVAFAVVLYIWTRRNYKPVDATAGTNMAINAFAEMFKNQNEQIEADRTLRKEEQEARRKQISELNEHYIESISANADATNRIADTVKIVADNQKLLTDLWNEQHKTQIDDTTIIKKTVEKIDTSVQKIDTIGSEPLQRAIEALTRIEDAVNQIATRQNADRLFFTDALVKISDAKNLLTQVDEKRATNTMQTVPPAEPTTLPVTGVVTLLETPTPT